MINTAERLQPGYKLALPSPNFLLDLKPGPRDIIRGNITFLSTDRFREALLLEYFSIYNLLAELVGIKNLVVIQDRVLPDRRLPDSWPKLEEISIPTLEPHYCIWPRDSLTVLENQVLLNTQAWRENDRLIDGWQLGEGGTVLTRKRALLIRDDLMDGCAREKRILEKAGYQVAGLPAPAVPEDYAVPKHIDSHLSLVEADNGDLVLVAAKSYCQQRRRQSIRFIDRATQELGISKVVVDDRDFPPLAFNNIQLADNTIVMTAGASALEEVFKDLVGAEKVRTTAMTIRMIPFKTQGSIRCLTTPLPDSLLSQNYDSCIEGLSRLRVSALR